MESINWEHWTRKARENAKRNGSHSGRAASIDKWLDTWRLYAEKSYGYHKGRYWARVDNETL